MIAGESVRPDGHSVLLGITSTDVQNLVGGQALIVPLDTLSLPGEALVIVYGETERHVVAQLRSVGVQSIDGSDEDVLHDAERRAARDKSESLTLDTEALSRAALALSGPASNGRNHHCEGYDTGDGCTICWALAADVIRAAEGLRVCSRCNGGALVAPGACCPQCGGDGLEAIA